MRFAQTLAKQVKAVSCYYQKSIVGAGTAESKLSEARI